jgi:hypothetical protein
MDTNYKNTIKYSIKYYFEIKPKFKSLTTSCNPNEAPYSDTNSGDKLDASNTLDSLDSLDDSYIDEYVNYKLIDVYLYKW